MNDRRQPRSGLSTIGNFVDDSSGACTICTITIIAQSHAGQYERKMKSQCYLSNYLPTGKSFFVKMEVFNPDRILSNDPRLQALRTAALRFKDDASEYIRFGRHLHEVLLPKFEVCFKHCSQEWHFAHFSQELVDLAEFVDNKHLSLKSSLVNLQHNYCSNLLGDETLKVNLLT